MTTADARYNGWTNYETWNIKLWIDNDQWLQEQSIEMAERAKADAPEHHNVPEIWTADEAARFTLADALKDWVTDPDNGMVPDLGATMAADLLGAALSEVDWSEIAQSLLDDIS